MKQQFSWPAHLVKSFLLSANFDGSLLLRIMYKHLSQVSETPFHLFHPICLPISTVHPCQMAPASFCSPKPPHVGLSLTIWLHSCLSSNPFCVSQFPYGGSHLTLLPFYYLGFALTLPSPSPQPPTFNLQPTVMTKYLPLILPPDNFLNQFIPIHLLLIYSNLLPGLYNIFLLVCLPASSLLFNSI